jgi:hypothetical protein
MAAREKETAFAERDPAKAAFQGLSPSNLARPKTDWADWFTAMIISFSPNVAFQMPCTLAEAVAVTSSVVALFSIDEESKAGAKDMDAKSVKRRIAIKQKFLIIKPQTSVIVI